MDKKSIQYLDTPDKSPNDKKEYKIMKLPNGLTALLVSDPSPVPVDDSSSEGSGNSEGEEEEEEEVMSSTSSEKDTYSEVSDSEAEGDHKLAACALLVDVGSFSDPSDINGLAHFLEHMIFMGSEKYPLENDFDSFIKKAGGFDNADTDCEETSFYFEIAEKYLDSAMDRFAQLLTAPLMHKEAMTRERESIESEFISKMHDDEVRRDQILATWAQPGHPAGIFTWGNLKTLKENIDDDELHRRVHEFRKRHYSAHRMYLCVQARLPLDELETMVIKNFSNIPSNNLPGDNFSCYNHLNAFKDEFFSNVFIVKPVTNISKLELTWCLPSLTNEYLCKPHEYIAYLFGYEGPGSLCAYLRQKLWALELVAGIDDSNFEYNSMYSLFNLYIYLTEDGFHHINEILAAIFSYIKLLDQQGPCLRLFEELKELEEMDFRFQTDQSAFDNVQDLVINLKYYPPKHVLTGPELYFEYNEKSIRDLISHLNTNKFNIMITSTVRYGGVAYDCKEPWFGTDYAYMPMPKKWEKLWKDAKIMPELYLPEKNIYISKNFNILWKPEGEALPLNPKKIIDTKHCELWYRQDDIFLIPKSYMYFYFTTPLPVRSPKNAVLLTLFSLLLKYQLVEELYPASVAGLYYQCYSADKGLVLKINGYNEKVHLIVDKITKRMSTFLKKLNEDQLKVFIKQQKRNYYNYFMKPKSLNKDIRLSIIEQIHWTSIEKYNLLAEITLEELRKFSGKLFKEMRIQALIQGNLTEKEANDVTNAVLRNIKSSGIKEVKELGLRTIQLPLGTNTIICNSLNENDNNTVVTNFYQIGPCTIRTECILDLLIMLTDEPLFDILRTKEQLGYDVSASVRSNNGILGYSITVNSQENKYNANYIQERIEEFQTQMMQILLDMPESDFEEVLSSLIKIKLIVDNELKDEVARNWSEITSEEYIFDRNKKEVECLRTFNKKTIIDFCQEMKNNQFRKLTVQVVGNTKTIENEETISADCQPSYVLNYISQNGSITDIDKFKGGLFVYPVTKTVIDLPKQNKK